MVWAENAEPNPRLDNRMKDVEDKLDLPPLKPELRTFVDWVSGYTLSPRGMVLRMALRMGEHLGPARERVGVRLAGSAPQRMTAARGRVLALLADGLARAKSDVAEGGGRLAGVIDGLIDEGTLESRGAAARAGGARARSRIFAARLHAGAARGGRCAARDRGQGGFGVTLLDGVTGSGKTQVYFEAVAEIIRAAASAGARCPRSPDRAVPRPFRRALRRAPGGVALAAFAAPARAHLERGRGRRRERGRRRALGAVPALQPISG